MLQRRRKSPRVRNYAACAMYTAQLLLLCRRRSTCCSASTSMCFIPGRAALLTENKALQCQLAVAAVQTSFVIGSVYLKSSFRLVQGLHFHPVIFAFAREAIAGPVLCAIAYATTGAAPKRADLLAIGGLGLCLYLNQASRQRRLHAVEPGSPRLKPNRLL